MNAPVNIALRVFATGRTVPRVSSGGVGCSSVQHRKQVGGSYAQQGSGENLQRVLNLTIRELVHDWQCVRFAHLPSRSPLAFLLWACYKKSAQNRDGDEMRKKKEISPFILYQSTGRDTHMARSFLSTRVLPTLDYASVSV